MLEFQNFWQHFTRFSFFESKHHNWTTLGKLSCLTSILRTHNYHILYFFFGQNTIERLEQTLTQNVIDQQQKQSQISELQQNQQSLLKRHEESVKMLEEQRLRSEDDYKNKIVEAEVFCHAIFLCIAEYNISSRTYEFGI